MKIFSSHKKKTIGILGGMGPEASANIYKKILKLAQKHYGAKQDYEYPPIVLFSLPMTDWDTTGFLNLDSVKKQLVSGIKTLERAGSDFIIIGCNTVHHFYKEMQSAVRIPIVNMISETVKRVQEKGFKKVSVLSTLSTNKLGVYQKELQKVGIDMVPITAAHQETITKVISRGEAGTVSKIDTYLLRSVILDLTRAGAQAIILGCTELPLAINQNDTRVPLFNSSLIIVEEAIKKSYGYVPSPEEALVPNYIGAHMPKKGLLAPIRQF